ncbi:cytochrome P460 family protein [Nitrosomonas sp.]|uniref:cytochrome P460 family protein n=1 Tax=Nitrosomonas sp. TaxID=42353 RepID=UPI00208595A6|nr:cytochrome P460 family protein [Nitrosomonas sp.]GJL75231.1 MAG: hypothetical protein NMNS02_13370 [Nitrosomonas sp.]
MQKKLNSKITGAILTAFSLTLALLHTNLVVADNSSFSPYVDKSGNISLPNDFRITMVHLGSFFVPEGDASGFHDVYTEAETALHYRKHGKFPDGATLVKELRPSKAGDYTTGKNVSYATGDIKQWFVMIKDTQERFKNSPIWGNGWGWALFKTTDISKNASNDYKADCLGCHIPAEKTDWIYIEGYPTLTAPN